MRKAVMRTMNKFFLIFRAQLLAALSSNRRASKRGKAAKAASLVGYLLLWLLIVALASLYEFIYAMAFWEVGVVNIFPALIVLLTSLLTLLSSISHTKSLIFCSKDYDLLFSLPVKGSVVVAAKIATLYVLDLFVSLALLLPCGVIYGVLAAPSWSFYILFFTLVLFVPLIPILIASLISALVSMVASRFKHARIVGTILYIALFIAFMLGIFSMNNMDDAQMGAELQNLVDGISRIYPPASWFVDAILGDFSMYALFAGVGLISFALIAFIFGRFYGKIHEMFRTRTFRSKFKVSETSSSARMAFLKKDMGRLFSSPGLLLNQMTGILMAVIFTVVFCVNGFDASGAEVPEMASVLGAIYPYVFALCASMACVTNTSISLEGPTIGLLKSLPASAKTILWAKLLLQVVLCFPVLLICTGIMAVLGSLSLIDTIFLMVIPLVYSFDIGLVGLLINLKKYNFNWTNEVMVAKNSLPVFVTMFGGMIAAMIPLIASAVFAAIGAGTIIPGMITLVVAAALGVILTAVLNAKGEQLLRAVGS